jgi:hypothetical protein
MKKIVLVINFLMLIFSFLWAYKTHWDYEPIIAFFGLICTLIGLLFSETKIYKKNILKIKGNLNKINQDDKKEESKNIETTENKININGDGNTIIQDSKTGDTKKVESKSFETIENKIDIRGESNIVIQNSQTGDIKQVNQKAEKIYNIDKIDNANFS